MKHAADKVPIIRGPSRPDLLLEETLPDLLEATARRVPHRIALVFGQQRLTYGELDAQADRVARHLIASGIRTGDLVGLWLPRGVDLLVMQAGIAKAGAGWLPFDADTPPERIAVCLEDARASGIVVASEWLELTTHLPVRVFGHRALEADREPAPVHRRDLTSRHPAYVIYTSGSTGKPKGILITQRGICHFLRSENAVLGVCQEDVVYQGFSVAFDMSFEEIWITYLVGATLWIAAKELATDPEALPDALESGKITVLHAVPTLLALFTRDVPSLRLINLGGEMCPDSLVRRWVRPGRTLFNTYGPTEATVSASLAELRDGEPVTIGTPLPNYSLLILGEDGTPLPAGQCGELCITGPGVADGYLGRPELTAEKFLTNPYGVSDDEARLYRTGDLAVADETGRIRCLGRTDDQVKIRGFRVELGEIEAALCRQAGVGTAAAVLRRDGGLDQLVAFLVGDGRLELTPSTLRAALKTSLPAYMVPARFEVIDALPRLASGKIDRNALRERPLSAVADQGEGDTPEGAAEEALVAAIEQLFPGQRFRRDADFFDDLGGHSLLATRLVSLLRTNSRFAQLKLNDVYRHRRLGELAAAMERLPPPESALPPVAKSSAWRRAACGLAQALVLPPLICLRILYWLAPFFTYHFMTGDEGDGVWRAIGASLLVFLLGQLSAFGGAILGRRAVLGRIKPGRYPLWGVTYFRWWLSDRMADVAPVYLISGSSLQNLYFRALGARIGRDVLIGSAIVRVPNLLAIGDGASIGNSVHMENARVERGELIIGRIEIGAEAYVASYAVLEGGTSIASGGRLQGLSALSDGQRIGEAEIWEGAPARFVGTSESTQERVRPALSNGRRIFELWFYGMGAMLTAALFFVPIFPTFIMVDSLDARWFPATQDTTHVLSASLEYFFLAIPASALLVVLTALLSAAIRWTAGLRVTSGVWPVHGAVYYRKWLSNQIQEASLNILHGVYATVYAPWWYRLLGAKVGRDAEISTAMGITPDMLVLGDETFIADGVMLGDEEVDGGWMTLQPTVIGHRSFVGNGAYVPDGSMLPENVLIGVQSKTPDNDLMRDGDTWLGSPPIRLPARERLCGFSDRLTYHPSWRRRLGRALVEATRIVLPLAITIGVGYLIVLKVLPSAESGRWARFALLLSLAGLLFGLGAFLFIVALKWILLGRYVPRAIPMWTPFVWLSEAVTNLYEAIAVPNFLLFLRGTPMLAPALRLLGARIGRGTYLDTTDITEFDCVEIGDYAELNSWSGPQTHLFEDRIMKIGRVKIGSHATIGARGIVLYDAEVGEGALLGPLTLVLKGESIPPHSAWTGSPAQPGRT